MVLIPKINNPEFMSDLRPISLTDVICKVLFKLINKRLTELLPKLISPNQSGFSEEELSQRTLC